ncbi:MAG: hypothetical protein ACYTFT_02385, partial [Planctomycetota bacterium]
MTRIPATLGLHPVVFLLPIVVRIVAFRLDPHPYFFMGDSLDYLLLEHPLPERPPGYNAFCLGWLALARGSMYSIVVAQSALGVVTALCYHHVASRYLRLGAAWSAAAYLAVGLWPTNLFFEHAVLSESLFCFLLALALLLAFRARAGGLLRAVALGCTLGLLVLVRPIGLVILPLALGYLLVRGGSKASVGLRARKAAVVVAGVAMVLLPYAACFYAWYGVFAITTSRGRAMLPYVARLAEGAELEDAHVQEVLARHKKAISIFTPERLRWDESGPIFELLPWTLARSELARRDGPLAGAALEIVINNPLGYMDLVADEARVLAFDVASTHATERRCQSQQDLDELLPPTHRLLYTTRLIPFLRSRFGYQLPARAGPVPGLLRALATSVDHRLPLLALALLLGLLAWRRRVAGILLLGGGALLLAFAPLLVQECYGRYFVPAINPLLVLAVAGLWTLPARASGPAAVALLAAQILVSVFGAAPARELRAGDEEAHLALSAVQGGAWGMSQVVIEAGAAEAPGDASAVILRGP